MTELPNIVLLTADSIRSDYCGFYDSVDLDTTPFLSDIADDSVVFNNAISPGPRTPSSVPTIFTGEYYVPSDKSEESWTDRVARIGDHIKRYPTIAERFKRRGYSTAAITANPWTTKHTNFDSGFDHFSEVGSVDKSFEIYPDMIAEPLEYMYQWKHATGWFTQWPSYKDEIDRIIDELEEPYFLWIFSLDSHNPYIVPSAFREESNSVTMYSSALRANSALTSGGGESHLQSNLSNRIDSWLKSSYRDSIRSVDKLTEWVWDRVEATDPLLIFHADHGEAFGDHGVYGHRPMLYEENISVPFLIANSEMSGTVDKQVSLRDLPEILFQITDNTELNVRSLGNRWDYLFTETGKSYAIRGEKWKLIDKKNTSELYNLSKDSREQRNIVKQNQERVEEFSNQLELMRESVVKKEETATTIQRLVSDGEIIPDILET